MANYVIVVAGGTGDRMKASVPKQFLDLGGRPVLQRTLEIFALAIPDIELVIAMNPAYIDYWKELCAAQGYGIPHRIVSGGKERFHSVKHALDALPVGNGIVGVHDAVRPLVNADTIRSCFNAANEFQAAIPVVPVNDSLRIVADNSHQSSVSVDRSRYVLVQTPQCFEISLLREAYNTDFRPSFTDDASVVEAAGHRVHLVAGNRENIKLTTRADLAIARALIDDNQRWMEEG